MRMFINKHGHYCICKYNHIYIYRESFMNMYIYINKCEYFEIKR